jgi:hypothetical protein
MEGTENKDVNREEVFSKAIRAGKRTYFFDVKATRSGENYLTITESKRRFSNEQGKFIYEKHKIFLYKEDFEKFKAGLNTVLQFIETGEVPEDTDIIGVFDHVSENDLHSDIDFDDLGSHEEEDKDK